MKGGGGKERRIPIGPSERKTGRKVSGLPRVRGEADKTNDQ